VYVIYVNYKKSLEKYLMILIGICKIIEKNVN
jgi:hypothetical protein